MVDRLQRSDKNFMGVLKAMMMTNIDRTNRRNRRIVDYKPCGIDVFFDSDHGVYNALVSGGDSKVRTSAMVAQAICAVRNRFPVVILHEGNKTLEQKLKHIFLYTGRYKEVSSNSPCFEPFFGLSKTEIADQILKTAPKEYDIKFNVGCYIDGISTILQQSGKHVSFKLLSTCPHGKIFEKVHDLEMKGKITNDQAQEIKSNLTRGQSEKDKLDIFLANLKKEMKPLMYVSKTGNSPLNIITALKSYSVLCLDLESITNKLLLNTIIYQLKLALTRGMQYEIIIDSIPINANELYASYISTPSDRMRKTIVSNDFYAMVGGNEKVFSTIIGNTQILMVMNHSSGCTAEKWAEVFGEYDKLEESYSKSCGESRETLFSLMPSQNYNKTVNVNNIREYVVKPEEIMQMASGEAYVRSAALKQLAHLILTD